MKLLTEGIKKRLPKLYETEEVGLNEKIVIAKFFLANFTWYVIEGQEEDEDFIFWGYVQNSADEYCSEFGYFVLSELESVNLRGVFKVERSLYFKEDKLVNFINKRF